MIELRAILRLTMPREPACSSLLGYDRFRDGASQLREAKCAELEDVAFFQIGAGFGRSDIRAVPVVEFPF